LVIGHWQFSEGDAIVSPNGTM